MRPEGFTEGHGNGSVFGEGGKNALGFLDVGEADVDAESCRLGGAAWRGVGGHENRVTDSNASVENFLLPFGWNLAGGGRAFVIEHHLDFGAEDFRVSG